MSHTLIHVGLHKSASTFLQQNVFPRMDADYVFLAAHRRRLLNEIEGLPGYFSPAWLREQVCGYLAHHHVAYVPGERNLILSHEELSGHRERV